MINFHRELITDLISFLNLINSDQKLIKMVGAAGGPEAASCN